MIQLSPSKDYQNQIKNINFLVESVESIIQDFELVIADNSEQISKNIGKNLNSNSKSFQSTITDIRLNLNENMSIDFEDKINVYSTLIKHNITDELFPFDDWLEVFDYLDNNSNTTERFPTILKKHKELVSNYFNFTVTPILNLFNTLETSQDDKTNNINKKLIENFIELKNSISNKLSKTIDKNRTTFVFHGGYLLNKINESYLKLDKKDFLILLSTKTINEGFNFLKNGKLPETFHNRFLVSAFINDYYETSKFPHEQDFINKYIKENPEHFLKFSTKDISSIFFQDKKVSLLDEERILNFIKEHDFDKLSLSPITELIMQSGKNDLLTKYNKTLEYLDFNKKIPQKEDSNKSILKI